MRKSEREREREREIERERERERGKRETGREKKQEQKLDGEFCVLRLLMRMRGQVIFKIPLERKMHSLVVSSSAGTCGGKAVVTASNTPFGVN